MWKLVEISRKTYFVYCNFNTTKQDFTFILYDLKDTWSQTLNLNDAKQKFKLFNKRYDFNGDDVKEALTGDNIQSASLEEQPHSSVINVDNCVLKLKYRVKNCCLSFDWELRRQNLTEFQQTFVQPLLVALLGCHQQVEILSECIRKKDEELKQYRIEGAVLNRRTLATKPFDFVDFNKKYEHCNEVAINFKELAKYVKENDSNIAPEVTVNKEEVKKPEEKQTTKMSPKERKRRARALHVQQWEQQVKLRKRGLTYESSQSSQTSTSGNSQSLDEAGAKDVKQIAESKNDKKVSSPRKSARCTPTKDKKEYISSEDKTDSENGDHFRTMKERKTLPNGTNSEATKTNVSKNQISNVSENNNSKETTKKCVKSLNLSYKTQTKSMEKQLDTSNVFDFSTDTEDKRTLNTKKKLLRPKSPASSLVENFLVESGDVKTSLNIKNLSHSPTPVILDDLSSQLTNIKKELECLEAMRLADLEQRIS